MSVLSNSSSNNLLQYCRSEIIFYYYSDPYLDLNPGMPSEKHLNKELIHYLSSKKSPSTPVNLSDSGTSLSLAKSGAMM
jgi:hypothetical protein